LVQDGRFLPEYFDDPGDANRLDVISDRSAEPAVVTEEDIDLAQESISPQETLTIARQLREQIDRIAELEETVSAAWERGDRVAAEGAESRLEALKFQIVNAMSTAGIDVMIFVPEGF